MKNIDLNSLTKLDLLDLRRAIDEELKAYKDRDKTRVFSIFIPFEGTWHFIKKENAIEHLNWLIEADLVFDEERDSGVQLKFSSLNNAELEYCYDYNQTIGNEPNKERSL